MYVLLSLVISLFFMNSDDDKQTNLVCYCGSVVEQTIQFDENGEPIFSNLFLMINSHSKNVKTEIEIFVYLILHSVM